MAGANNKAMKAAGLPKKTMDTARVALGAGLSVQSAIRHAQAHGLPLGKAAKHAGELTGWQRAAAGGVSPAEKAAASAAREAYVAGQARKAALGAAMAKRQGNLARTLGAVGQRMLTKRAVDAMMTRQRAKGRTAIADGKLGKKYAEAATGKGATTARKAMAAAKPKFKGAGPFNVDRHKARAMALSDARKAQLKAADAKLQAAKTPEERATANKAYNLAQRRADNAAALNRGASAKVSERDAVRRGEKGTRDAQMRQFRSDLSGMRAPGKGQAHIMTAEGPKVVDTVASSKNFFVHKEPGYGGQFVVSHRDTGMAITQSNTLSGAKRVMDGMKKTGHLTMRRLEQGGAAGERSARAMAKYLSAPKRRNVSLAERGLRAGTAPTKRGKEANAAAGIR